MTTEQRLREAQLFMRLKSATGYESEETHKITPAQWTLIQQVLADKPLSLPAQEAQPVAWALFNNKGLVKWYVPTFYPLQEPDIFTGRYDKAHPDDAPFYFAPLYAAPAAQEVRSNTGA